VALPIYFVLMQWKAVAATAAITAVTMLILKKTWYDRLED
jgi:hypothetical protein